MGAETIRLEYIDAESLVCITRLHCGPKYETGDDVIVCDSRRVLWWCGGVSGAHIIMYCSVFWFGFSDAFHSSHFTLGKCFVVQLPASAPSNYIVLFVGNKNQTECRTPSSRAPLCSVSVLRKKKWRTERKTKKKTPTEIQFVSPIRCSFPSNFVSYRLKSLRVFTILLNQNRWKDFCNQQDWWLCGKFVYSAHLDWIYWKWLKFCLVENR